MGLQIRAPRDLCAGLIYLGVGAAALYFGQELQMGTARKMGPAFFPAVLAWLLLLIGALAVGRSLLKQGEPLPTFAWRPLLRITAAALAFGLLVRGAGLLVALPLFVFMTASASIHFRWLPTLVLAVVATAFCSLVFVVGLGVPLPLIGAWLGG